MSWFQEHASGVQRAVRWLAILLVLLAGIQPLLGSAGFFRSSDTSLNAHEGLANLIFLVALAIVPLAFLGGFKRRNLLTGWSVALLIAVVAQIGMGYATRDSLDIVIYHITLGVLIFGAAVIVALLSYGLTLNRQNA